MSKSNFNIKELESKFDSILESISIDEIREWERFDKCADIREKFFSGQFQPVEVSDVKIISLSKENCQYNIIEEVFDYQVNPAC